MLLRRIVANQENSGSIGHITHGSRRIFLSGNSPREGGKIGSAMVVNVVGSQHRPRKFLQQIVFFIGGAIRSEEHTSELQSLTNLVCRLLLEKKKNRKE